MATEAAAALRAFKSAEDMAAYLRAYDAVLREWPVPFAEIDLPTSFGTTHVIASGPPDAPAVVLLPSLAASATVWRPNVAALSNRFRTYAVDVIGQPGKSIASRKIRDRRDLAAWLSEVLDALHVPGAALVGSSYGAFVALNQAVATPERVTHAVAIGPAGVFAGLPLRFYYTMLVAGPLRRLLRPQRKPDIDDLLGTGSVTDKRDARWRELMSVTMSAAAMPNVLRTAVFSAAELAAIRAPVLLLVGERERLYDAPTLLRLAARRLPNLEGAVIPGAHHLAALARPDAVNARILEFLLRERTQNESFRTTAGGADPAAVTAP
jgi:pimeloyl-ACP methyl ester carboxylesterase